MKKKNIVYLFVLVILIGIALVLIFKNKNGSLSSRLKDFAVEDTASITRIFIADKRGKSALLERQAEGWWKVNGKYKVRQDLMGYLLESIKRVEVQSPVSNIAMPNVQSSIAASGMKVEIYHEKDLIKCYYVGGSTPDDLGTYMVLQDADKPFITNIPGFNGYLSIRYISDEDVWRDRAVFRCPAKDIASVRVEFPGDQKNSFLLKILNKDFIQLTNFAGDTAKNNIDGDFLRHYLSNFTEIIYEFRGDNKSQGFRDSVLSSQTYCRIELTDKKGNKTTATLAKRYINPDNQVVVFDKDKYALDQTRIWVAFEDGKSFVCGQYPVFNPLTPQFGDFFKKKSSKE